MIKAPSCCDLLRVGAMPRPGQQRLVLGQEGLHSLHVLESIAAKRAHNHHDVRVQTLRPPGLNESRESGVSPRGTSPSLPHQEITVLELLSQRSSAVDLPKQQCWIRQMRLRSWPSPGSCLCHMAWPARAPSYQTSAAGPGSRSSSHKERLTLEARTNAKQSAGIAKQKQGWVYVFAHQSMASTALCWCGLGTKPDSSPLLLLRTGRSAAATNMKAARSACVHSLIFPVRLFCTKATFSGTTAMANGESFVCSGSDNAKFGLELDALNLVDVGQRVCERILQSSLHRGLWSVIENASVDAQLGKWARRTRDQLVPGGVETQIGHILNASSAWTHKLP